MNLSPVVFYGLSAGLVVSAILSTAVPKAKTSWGAQVLMLVFCLGMLLNMGLRTNELVLAAFCLILLIMVGLKSSAEVISLPKPNFRIGFLVWIVLGSFLLIIAVVLKYTNWTPLRWESLPDWRKILSEYGVLLTTIVAFAIVGLIWKKLKKR